MPETQLNKPTVNELFSGRPCEWSPYDVDSRCLRWGSLGFDIVDKGAKANPQLRDIRSLELTDLDREKLWRLTQAAGKLVIAYDKPCYGKDEKFVFVVPRERTEMPPAFDTYLKVSSFTHILQLRLLESRTGRADLLLSFTRRGPYEQRQSNSLNAPIDEPLDLSGSTLALRSTCDNHIMSRALIGSPQLVVFQNVQVGESYELIAQRPITDARLSRGDIVFIEPVHY